MHGTSICKRRESSDEKCLECVCMRVQVLRDMINNGGNRIFVQQLASK